MFEQRTFIEIRTQFEGIHCWDNCPIEQVAFLKNPHRHMFGVRVRVEVYHNDRDLEFICVKRSIDQCLTIKADMNRYPGTVLPVWDMGRTSCEMVAEMLHEYLKNTYKFDPNPDSIKASKETRLVEIEVNEDGENGAIVQRVYK